MRCSTIWATDAEIYATANLFGVDIVVCQELGLKQI